MPAALQLFFAIHYYKVLLYNLLLLYFSCTIEVQHVKVKDCEILALKFVLLSLQKVGLASHQLHNVLQTLVELFGQQLVACLCALRRYACRLKLVLIVDSLQPVVLHS